MGEFAECRNVSSGNLTGKYALFVHSLNAADIFRPGNDIVKKFNYLFFKLHKIFDYLKKKSFKYGMCVPNKCTQSDIVDLINFFIKQHHVDSFVSLKPLTNSSIIFQEAKVLDWPAIATLTLLLSIVFLVVMCTIYDIVMRLKQYFLVECNMACDLESLTINNDLNSSFSEINQFNSEEFYLKTVKSK